MYQTLFKLSEGIRELIFAAPMKKQQLKVGQFNHHSFELKIEAMQYVDTTSL